MRIHTDLSGFHDVRRPVLTTGTFDGVHTGHQVILRRLKEVAAKENGETVLFTFYPHPRMVLQPQDNDLKLLSTQKEKEALLAQAGLDHLIVMPFSRTFSRMHAPDYVRDVLVDTLRVRAVVVGYDHRFGRNREGDLPLLKRSGGAFGFLVEEIPAQEVDHVKVSSTKIREALLAGEVDRADELLGYAYPLSGVVVKGEQRGRELGYPTANIAVNDPFKLVPGNGVYVVTVTLNDGEYKGMMNIGVRPTIPGASGERSIEAHLFGLDREIYGEQITVHLHHRLRDEIRFPGLDALIAAMDRDRSDTLVWFEGHRT
jgi:riboflavin kinase / FMN adenylyltransferase